MLCELCNEQDATVHLTQVVEGQIKKLHLCEACAQKSGFDVQGPISITDILLGMGVKNMPASKPVGSEKSCPRCHMSRTDFKKTGRFGCAACYDAFAEDLPVLLRAMHRSDRHIGKFPANEQKRHLLEEELERLQVELKQAIAEEKYEDAATLRDRIHRFSEEMAANGESPA